MADVDVTVTPAGPVAVTVGGEAGIDAHEAAADPHGHGPAIATHAAAADAHGAATALAGHAGNADAHGSVTALNTHTGDVVVHQPRLVVNHAFMGTVGLDTLLKTLGGSWWSIDPAEYGGGAQEWRLVIVVAGATVGDVIEFVAFDADTNANHLSATGTVARSNGQRMASPWQAVPAAAIGGYVRARNTTLARGAVYQAWIELRRVG